jgi:hypothetical protein
MPNPPPDNPEVAKVTLVFTRDTRTFLNVFHIDAVTPWDLPRLTILCQDMAQWYGDHYAAALPASVSLTQVQGRVLNPDVPLAFDLAVSPPAPGLRAGSPSPGNVTSTVSWRTGWLVDAFDVTTSRR